ncbi:MAG: hypothetical protein Kow0029_19040 [Candidatus Rifleibacteriota bacterium]
MRSVEMPRRNDPLAKETHWFIRSEAEKVYVCPEGLPAFSILFTCIMLYFIRKTITNYRK